MRYVTVTGHRGAPRLAPENTIPSFLKAIELGVDFVELDVRLTKDGIPVVIHDDKVDRTTNGSGPVSLYTLEKLKTLDAGSWFSSEFRGIRIPTLCEALEAIDGKVFVEIELKEDGAVEPVVEIVEELGLVRKVLVSSFQLDRLKRAKKICPKIPLVWIVEKLNEEVVDAAIEVGVNRLDVLFSELTFDKVRAIHFRGLTVNGWVIDKLSDAELAVEMDVDNVTTNRPEIIVKLYESLIPLPEEFI